MDRKPNRRNGGLAIRSTEPRGFGRSALGAIGGGWLGIPGLLVLLLIGSIGWAGGVLADVSAQIGRAEEPFLRLREQGTRYHGPGREREASEELTAVQIAFFGPRWHEGEETDLWVAAQLALDQANAAGGYQGKPFRLLATWSDDPWGDGASQLARLIYDQPVWAILGAFDGHSAHLAALLVAKARLPVVIATSGDKSVNLANVPWVYSLLPGDHLQSPPLAEAIAAVLGGVSGGGRLVVLSADQHDTRHFARELMNDLARRHRVTPRLHLQSQAGAAAVEPHARRAVEARPEAIVVLAGPEDSARLVEAIRSAGYRGPVFGGAAMGRRAFVERLGNAAQQMIYPRLFTPGESSQEFVARFQEERGYPPDYAAAHTYDATRLIIRAVREAGLNRARINDALRERTPWDGITGTIVWDPVGSNRRPVRVNRLP